MSGNIRDIIKELVKDNDSEIFSKVCKVLSVDEEQRTANLEPIDGTADILNARLQASTAQPTGVAMIPKVGSMVIASFISPSKSWISGVDEPEKILIDAPEMIINGGGLKGLIIYDQLKAELERNKAILEGILGVLRGASIPEPGNGSPSALQAALKAALIGKQTGDFGNHLINEKVKHG